MKSGIVTLARIIGRRFGVNVVVDPNVGTAATNGKTIFIPPVDLSLKEDAELLEGLIDHEAMHCRLTEFEVCGDTPLERGLANIFEDVWGETDFAGLYPGTRRTIKRAAEIMVDRGIIGIKMSGDEHPAELVGATLVNGLRSRVLGQDSLEEAFLHNHELLKQAVGVPLAEKLWETSMKVRGVHSTREALDLTREVIDLIKGEQEEQQQESGDDGDSTPDAGKSDASESGEDGEGKNQTSGEGENSSQDDGGPGQGKTSKSSPTDNGKEDSGGRPAKAGGSNPSSQGGADKGSQGNRDAALEAIGKILAADEGDLGKTDLGEIVQAALPPTPPIDFTPPLVEKPFLAPGRDALIDARIRVLRNSLASRLAHLFDTQEETRVWLDKRGRKLDHNRLAGVPVGRQHVFRKLEYGDEVSVEVSLVIDCSTSMRVAMPPEGSRLGAAQSIARSLGDVLDMHDIPFSVTLFAESVCAYKTTDQNWKAAKRCRINLANSGDTRTGWAVIEGSKDIMFSDRERRIMLVVTDGIPDDVDFAVSESAEIQKTGVEVRYIMIGESHGNLSNALRAAGVFSSIATSPDALAKSVFEAVEPRLAQREAA